MAFAAPLAIAAAVAGTGITMIGQAQAAKATEAQDLSQAQYRTALGDIYQTRAQQQQAAGFQRAEDVGLQYGARVARERVFGGAGNIAGPSLQNTIASTLALGQLSQRRTIATAGEAAFGEQLRGTEETYTAGLDTRAAADVSRALPIQEAAIGAAGLGKIAGMGMETSQLGGATPVSSKWYS
jgi:hypothetical protein